MKPDTHLPSPTASIIMPAFNAETSVGRAIESILAQSDQDFELILVDDGSEDGTGCILAEYATKHSHVTLLKKSNGGASSARNLALSIATGQWILFVDADDTVEPDFVARMRNRFSNNDLVVCAYDHASKVSSRTYRLTDAESLDLQTVYTHSFCTQQLNGGCCNKAFKASIIKEHQLYFDETLWVAEDMVFLASYYLHCKSAAYVPDVLYHYTVNASSLTQKALSSKTFGTNESSALLAMDRLTSAIDLHPPNVRNALRFRLARSGLRTVFQMAASGVQSPRLLQHAARHMRAGRRAFLASPHSNWIEKTTVVGFSISATVLYKLAAAVLQLHHRRVV